MRILFIFLSRKYVKNFCPWRRKRLVAREIEMTQLTLDMPEEIFATLHQTPKEFAGEMRIAAAVKWYELLKISRGRGAEIAGLSRAAFIDALSRYQVCPFQYTDEELQEELRDVD
ncbi:MAG: UPF0175 family protein [Methylomonas sp.]